ncbi:MAG TPA: ATP-binding protein [Solirubrobacteraceae bacterium]
MNLLGRVTSIKLKLSIVIVAAVFTTAAVGIIGVGYLDLPGWGCALIASALGLAVVQVLARGLTSPLRAMEAAATAMAAGEHGQRVHTTSRDEVGRLAAAFNVMAAELDATDQLRRDLVANASHELRTPISALRAVLENLVDGVADADEQTLRAMLAQTERLQRLVAQLLDLSRLEAGAEVLDARRFDVTALLREVARESPGVEVAGGEPLYLVADPDRLRQVVTNLVENAVRHTPAGEPVRLRATAAGGAIRLEVVDGGPGIAPADRERVFERFVRADAARARDDGGAGLGLAIARWIVDLHGGTIRAEAAEPRGCRMVVSLPGSGA